jgi:transcription elongation factor Elf1
MRFTQTAYPTVYFSTLIWVHCPNCNKAAKVETSLAKFTIPEPQQHQSTLKCSHCSFIKKHNEVWHGLYQSHISIACGFCGSTLHHTTKPTKKVVEKTIITCEVCKKEKEYTLHWYKYKQGIATDPYFGLDLYLQVNIKDNVLWVYNMYHLP